MKVFVAGASGTIGIPLVRSLVAAGHEVTAMTRSPNKQAALRSLGATPIVADALNRDAILAAVMTARPTHVIHQLTALPKDGARSSRDLEATNRLRIEGTRNLLDAAINAGALRLIVGSFALLSDRGAPAAEPANDAAVAVQSMERQVMDATARGAIEGIILRYGLFYGPETPSTARMIELVRKRRLPVVRGDSGQLPVIHIDDAVSATLAALDRGRAGSAYDIVDDEAVSLTQIVEAIAKYSGAPRPFTVPAWLPRLFTPYMARLLSTRMPLSNRKAKVELAWLPKYWNINEGLARTLSQAA